MILMHLITSAQINVMFVSIQISLYTWTVHPFPTAGLRRVLRWNPWLGVGTIEWSKVTLGMGVVSLRLIELFLPSGYVKIAIEKNGH